MPVSYTETKNSVSPKRQVRDGSCQHENLIKRGQTYKQNKLKQSCDTWRRRLATLTDPMNGTEKFEKEILVKK